MNRTVRVDEEVYCKPILRSLALATLGITVVGMAACMGYLLASEIKAAACSY
jgi:hypothetical protein